MYQQVISIEDQINNKLYLVNIVVSQMNLRESSILSIDDYKSVGLMGLYDAIRKYDKSKNNNFDSYAKIRIRGAILDEMRRVGEISRKQITSLNKFYSVLNQLREDLMREPNDDEIMNELDIDSIELNNMYQIMSFLSKSSLDEIIFDDIPLMNQVESNTFLSPEESLLKKEKYKDLSNKIKLLDQRLQMILDFIYVKELSLKEISSILDIGVSRVSQLHGKALIQLKGLYSI